MQMDEKRGFLSILAKHGYLRGSDHIELSGPASLLPIDRFRQVFSHEATTSLLNLTPPSQIPRSRGSWKAGQSILAVLCALGSSAILQYLNITPNGIGRHQFPFVPNKLPVRHVQSDLYDYCGTNNLYQ